MALEMGLEKERAQDGTGTHGSMVPEHVAHRVRRATQSCTSIPQKMTFVYFCLTGWLCRMRQVLVFALLHGPAHLAKSFLRTSYIDLKSLRRRDSPEKQEKQEKI